MTTRYSLPAHSPQSDTARGARTLAAIVLVVAVMALTLLAVVVPTEEPAVAVVADDAPQAAPSVPGA